MLDERQIEEKKRFAGPKKPSMKRRSDTHDYHSKRFYMVTMEVVGRRAVLGELQGDERHATIALSTLGRGVEEEWLGIPRYYPQVVTVKHQVMPDHFHGIIYVKEATDFHLGQVMKGFKLGCNRRLRGLLAMAAIQTPPTSEGAPLLSATEAHRLLSFAAIQSQPPSQATLWEKGYNDKILHNYSTLDKWKSYVEDNPRRLAIRRTHPDYFRVRFGLQVAGREYAAIGNRFLLQYPERVQVQLSRSLTDEQIRQKTAEYLAMARAGAVLVSPAISPGEQAVMRAALDARLPLVFLTPWGFNSFSKPGHQYFDACAEGRFLILAPWVYQNERVPLTRAMCLTLNTMTEQICNL